jgi:hypothetical protein
VRSVSAGAERRGGVLCVAPAYVVSPQAKKQNIFDGDFDADHGFAFDGVGRPAHQSRARGPIEAEAAAVRAPLLCIRRLHQKKKEASEADRSFRYRPSPCASVPSALL